MVRYHNYDIRSPYNRDAALWVANQTSILFPTDPRPLRDLRAALGRVAAGSAAGSEASPAGAANGSAKSSASASQTPPGRVRRFVERYGRVFGNTPESRNPQPDGRALPRSSELHALVTAEFDSGRSGGGPGGESGRDVEVLILETEPQRASTPPAAPPPQREVPRPANEEILYIIE
jgi:hypothetical protein